MSSALEVVFGIGAVAAGLLLSNRNADAAEKSYKSYSRKYEKMKKEGYSAYIPEEMERMESNLNRMRDMITSDPAAARDYSYELGDDIRSMSSLAKEAREQFDRAERMRVENLRAEKEHQKNELMQCYFDTLKTITNPIVVNYSISEMQKLRDEIESGGLTSKAEFEKRARDIISNAETKASEWKKNTKKKNRQKDMIQAAEETEERLKNEKIENKEKTQEFLDRISKLRSGLESGEIDADSAEQEMKALDSDVDEEFISEEKRRQVVIAVVEELKNQEFTVEKPQLMKTDGKNYVKIVAKKPSGKRVVCNVDLHGKLAYRFDNYEGMTCLKDIEKFNVDLERIYSIKLSDERVLWQNPDRLSMDANSLPNGEGRKA